MILLYLSQYFFDENIRFLRKIKFMALDDFTWFEKLERRIKRESRVS
jgi:hypothetical protein